MPHHYLDDDTVTCGGQRYALISVVSPTSTQKTTNGKIAIKIRGCFETKQEAQHHAAKIMEADNAFDVFLADMYRWLVMPPDPEQIADQKYSDKQLEDMMTGYEQSQAEAKQAFLARKRAVMEEGLDKHLTDAERLAHPNTGNGNGSTANDAEAETEEPRTWFGPTFIVNGSG